MHGNGRIVKYGRCATFRGPQLIFKKYTKRAKTLQKLEQRFSTLNTDDLSLVVTHQVSFKPSQS